MQSAFSRGVYPPPHYATWHDGSFDATGTVTVYATPRVPEAHLRRLADALRRYGSTPEVTRFSGSVPSRYAVVITQESAPVSAPDSPSEDVSAEGFRLTVDANRIEIAAATGRGCFYGIDAVCRMIERGAGRLPHCTIEDSPAVEVRGVHLFLPSREDLPFFLRLLDFLARYRYNTVYLELAAGMEFKSHPEINTAWDRFSQDLATHPLGAQGLQESMWFDWKNDPHPLLAGGSWLTQAEVRQIVREARRLHIEIIPEVQALAHAYWLTTAHPEIAEAQDDPYPDTYCPSNPRSYEILFDCMEEIVDVFQPRVVHIGHDEVYTMRRCPECRKKSAAELFATDVNRIHGWLAERGIRTAMWCDKLLDIDHPDGNRYGGVMRRVFKGKKQWVMPATAKAVDMIPRDIILVDWYYMLDDSTPQRMAERGFTDLVYGNFSSRGMDRWPEFRNMDIVKGAEISTWTNASEDILARHVRFPHIFIEGAATLWWRGYDPALHAGEARKIARALAPAERDRVGNRESLLGTARRKPERFAPVALDPALTEAFPPGGMSVDGIQPGGAQYGGIPFTVPAHGDGVGAFTVRFTSPIVRIPLNVSTDGIIALIGTSIERPLRTRNDELYLGPDVAGQLRFHFGAETDPDRDRLDMDLIYGGTLFPWNAESRSYWADPVVHAVRVDGAPLILYAVEWTNPWPDRPIRLVDLVWRGGRTMEGEVCLLGITAQMG